MIPPHAKTQQKIIEHVNMLPDDADITVPMFYHLFGQNKSVINRSLRKLVLKGLLVFDRTEPPSRGGQQMNIYRKPSAPRNDTFEFGLVTEGVFADLFRMPVEHEPQNIQKIRLLTGKEEWEADDDLS